MLRQLALTLAVSTLVPVAGAATPFAPGAVLSIDQGTVLVNNGSQFVTAKPGQALKAGDRVMVMTGGVASVSYSDGHTAALPAGTLVSFDARGFGGYSSGTAPATGRATPIGPMYAQAVGQGGASGSSGHGACQWIDDQGNTHNPCVIWVFAGLGAAAIIAASHHGGTRTYHSISAP